MINAVGSNGSTIWNNSARAAGASCGRCSGNRRERGYAERLAARFFLSSDMRKAGSSSYERLPGRKSLYGRCRISGPSFDACVEYLNHKEKISHAKDYWRCICVP